jgi:CubicO group peptidase (beta-lactamase class C family)
MAMMVTNLPGRAAWVGDIHLIWWRYGSPVPPDASEDAPFDGPDMGLAATGALASVSTWPVGEVGVVARLASGRELRVGDVDRPFELASVSKLLTALAVLIAVEEESVALEDLVGPPGSTLADLLAHTSGLALDGEIVSRPAARRIYSNAGIERAAAHVEARSGIAFETYLYEAVLLPLSMSATTLTGSPAFGMRSSVNDMVRFAEELRAPRLVSSEMHERMITPHLPDLAGVVPGFGKQAPCPWGLGAEIRGHKSPHWTGAANSPETFGHFGRSGTMLWVDPVADVTLVALTDRDFDVWAKLAWPRLSDAVLFESRPG